MYLFSFLYIYFIIRPKIWKYLCIYI